MTPERTQTKNMVLRLDPGLAEMLATVAEVEGRSVSDVAREAIADLVGARRKDKRFRRLLEDNLARHQRLLDLLQRRPPMIILDVADLVVIAGQALGIGTDAALNQVDLCRRAAALAEADCGAPRSSTETLPPRDQAHARTAAHRPFPIHGDRIAVAAGLQFLSLNGWRAELDPPAAAAVIVEALACGQLSPASAAAWLSPRLPGDGRLRPGTVHRFRSLRPVSALHGQRKPPSVSYPQTLLSSRPALGPGGLAGLSPVSCSDGGRSLRARSPVACPARSCGRPGGSESNARPAARPHPSKGTWRAVIITELAMTCFGVLWLVMPAFGFIMLGFIGAILSLAAVLCMTRPRARQYFFDPGMRPVNPDPRALSGPSSFSQLALTRHAVAGI